MSADFDDSNWLKAAILDHGKPKGMADAFGWMLVPSSLPQMERTLAAYPNFTQSRRYSRSAVISNSKNGYYYPAKYHRHPFARPNLPDQRLPDS